MKFWQYDDTIELYSLTEEVGAKLCVTEEAIRDMQNNLNWPDARGAFEAILWQELDTHVRLAEITKSNIVDEFLKEIFDVTNPS